MQGFPCIKSKCITFSSYLPQKLKQKPSYNISEKAMFPFVCACEILLNKNTLGKKLEQWWSHYLSCLTFGYRGWV